MLRVTSTQNGNTTTLKLEGNLSGPWVDELRRCWAELEEAKAPVEIDLHELNFLDPRGAALLLEMEHAGSRCVGSSPFIQDVLYCENVLLNPWPDRFTMRRN